MSLSTEQTLLLMNLVYTCGEGAQSTGLQSNMSVGDYIRTMDPAKFDGYLEMSASEWSSIKTAVEHDPQLMNVQVLTVDKDYIGDGFNVVFTDPSSNEAVVAFTGTSGATEWRDNFMGGYQPDTDCQKAAQRWFQDVCKKYDLDNYDITLTGHSKGGNKAKYVTLMDGRVDRCLSFDGQGFSDKFIENNKDIIAQRQHLIENHNVDSDYVNILLNDVGERHYYKAQNIDGLLEYHCPNSYFQIDENGNVTLEPGPQTAGLAEADKVMNSILRSLPSDTMRESMLKMFGDLVVAAHVDGFDAQEFASVLAKPESIRNIGFLVAYLGKYAQENEAYKGVLEFILGSMGISELAPVLERSIDLYIYWRTRIPDFIFNLGAGALEDFLRAMGGIIPTELLDFLLAALCIRADMKSGEDHTVPSRISNTGIKAESTALTAAGTEINRVAAQLRESAEKLAAANLPESLAGKFNSRINGEKKRLDEEIAAMQRICSMLTELGDLYAQAESSARSLAE